MSTNYNNYTFNIFKMNTGILTITSTNKRKKILIFIPIHLWLTCTWQKNWKVWNFVSHTRPHSCSSLAEQKKYFLQTYTGDSLSLSLSLSVEALRTWTVGLCILLLFLLSVLSRHCIDFALFFFLFSIFSDFGSLLFIRLFNSKSFVVV